MTLVTAVKDDPEASSTSASDQTEAVTPISATGATTPMSRAMAAMSDELASRVLALAEANRELESFSYTVSHDLRTPLTIIENYVFLLRRNAAALTPDERKALEGIHAAVQRMSLIIQNILHMSRVTRLPLNRQRVNVAEIARQVVAELREREPSRNVSLVAPAELWANADPAILRIALANLLANAWKFSARRQEAHLEVGMVPGRTPPTYFVKDDGIGFDMDQSSRLFKLFQRLHEDDFPGTGIGLVTVHRAIARHDGATWAESAPGAGATFFFTLGAQADLRVEATA